MTTTYRKTATIEATQWFKMGDHPAVVLKSDPNRYADEGVAWCPTMEGGHIVTPGDWIATGIKGEHWPIKPDVFAETYTPVDAALSTPATEPQGYVDVYRALNQWLEDWEDDLDMQAVADMHSIIAARPDPQPAADTRVVDQEWMPIETAPRDGTWFRAKTMGSPGFEQIRLVHFADKYDRLPINGEDVMWTRLPTHWQPLSASAIIDNATPAPSDKIAEAARVLLDDLSAALGTDGGEYCRASARRWSVASDAAEAAPTAMYRPTPIQMIRAALRALAGKGE